MSPDRANSLRVLVVDDEPGIRSVCRSVLEDLRCTVLEAPDLAAAKKALDGPPLHLVILDVRLPDGSGLDLFRVLRDTHPDLPVAIITGHASVEDAVDAVKSGALDYITKPFDDVNRLKEIAHLAAHGQIGRAHV
jgi:DNA-binding NtrC family response regulator